MLVISLILTFVLILYLVNKNINLGFSTMAGAVLLAILTGLSLERTAAIIFNALIDNATVELVIDVFLIVVLSKMMQDYGVLHKMVENLELFFGSPKVLLFVIPSLLSTFTATGSAIVAAPVIDSLGERTGISKARRAAINLYIRHAWYFVLPLSVALLNAAYIADIRIFDLIKVQLPATVVCLAAAYFVYIAPIKTKAAESESVRTRDIIGKILLYSSPLLFCIVLVIWVPFYIALLIACFVTFLIKNNKKNLYDVLIRGQIKGYNLIYAVAGIMVFKDVIQNIPDMRILMQNIIGIGIPVWLAGILLAVILAFISGSPQIVTAMLYPILLPLVPANETVVTAMLIYITGFTSYFISPIHLCQALTNEFFKVSLKELYREYYITVPVMFFSGVVLYFIIR